MNRSARDGTWATRARPRINLNAIKALFAWALFPVLCAVSAWLLASNAHLGADFPRYEDWSRALVSQDIFELRSRVASPLGLPLSVHAVGTGMLLAVGR